MPYGGYPRSPKLLKGSFVELKEKFLDVESRVIPFQFNPQSITRNLVPFQESYEDGLNGGKKPEKDTSQPFDPPENFTITLELDATDALEFPENNPVAVSSGIADRIAAIEMLLYPAIDEAEEGPVPEAGSTLSKEESAKNSKKGLLMRKEVSMVLFNWGPGRSLPVRLTSFSVEEQLYSPSLFPIHAKVTIGLKVLTRNMLAKNEHERNAAVIKMAIQAYENTLKQKQELAELFVSNSAASKD